ncbi:MAG: hypothetical protein ACU0AX_08810 [Roseovarius sp.]|uniref:hypothetical protein n=1 Tax=Roseovarius sp. TaxID=1486281 RepID=UPI004058922B
MRRLIKCFTAPVFGVGLAVAPMSALSADPDRYIPVLEQRAAILDCRYEMGLRGPARFGAEWPEVPPGGQTITWILPASNLSPAETDQINECADERLGRNPTPRFASNGRNGTSRRYVVCPRHAPVLFGGTTYCIKGN